MQRKRTLFLFVIRKYKLTHVILFIIYNSSFIKNHMSLGYSLAFLTYLHLKTTCSWGLCYFHQVQLSHTWNPGRVKQVSSDMIYICLPKSSITDPSLKDFITYFKGTVTEKLGRWRKRRRQRRKQKETELPSALHFLNGQAEARGFLGFPHSFRGSVA